MGNWNKSKPLLLGCDDDFPLWTGSINAEGITFPLSYKYGIYNINKNEVVTIEEGYDRQINSIPASENEFQTS